MLGWILLFALLTLLCAIPAVLGDSAIESSMTTASVIFGVLFVACILTRIVRQST